jgi:hypothetical protein
MDSMNVVVLLTFIVDVVIRGLDYRSEEEPWLSLLITYLTTGLYGESQVGAAGQGPIWLRDASMTTESARSSPETSPSIATTMDALWMDRHRSDEAWGSMKRGVSVLIKGTEMWKLRNACSNLNPPNPAVLGFSRPTTET